MLKRSYAATCMAACLATFLGAQQASAVYKAAEHKLLAPGAIAVTKAGDLDQAGKTYMLTQDISSPTSTLFLAPGTTLDLNGYTLTYAAGPYEHVPNYGFEKGLTDWDVSKAPGAVTKDTDKVKPFDGKKILSLPKQQEIVSKYITLPVANRSYYAMCGVLDQNMRVTISVEDEKGQAVRCATTFGDNVRPSCPQSGNPKMGGGFVFAHLKSLPAGKYRIRVTADTDCLIDDVDIRPALDVGVGIVDKVLPWAYYKSILDGDGTAFADYVKPGSSSEALATIPRVTGKTTITIRNGIIKSGFDGIRSWGVQSTAADATIVLDNVKIVASGINTNGVHVPRANINNCRFEINTPFIISRHRLDDMPVAILNADNAEVQNCEFIGGQGNLYIRGKKGTLVHDNLFVNHQTVTNHYSLSMGGCDNAKVYNNRFEPVIGSNLELFDAKNNEIYNNSFKVVAANGNCEYTNTDYSTNAIRITDYNSKVGSPKGSIGNKIYGNKFDITGRAYTNYESFKSTATAFFVSVGAGTNFIHDNQITVHNDNPDVPACVAVAFYIGGSNNGGDYSNNTITTNVPAFWIGTYYGDASNVKITGNTFIKAKDAAADVKPFHLGYGHHGASNIEFHGNKFVNWEFGVQQDAAFKNVTFKRD